MCQKHSAHVNLAFTLSLKATFNICGCSRVSVTHIAAAFITSGKPYLSKEGDVLEVAIEIHKIVQLEHSVQCFGQHLAVWEVFLMFPIKLSSQAQHKVF